MRIHRCLAALAVAGSAIVLCPAARAQSPAPRPQGDVAGVVGWNVMNTGSRAPRSDEDWRASFWAASSGGWYWSHHLKTEVDAGIGTTVRAYRSAPVNVEGRTVYESVQSRLSRRTVGVSQQYQFFRNAWFHPHVAAGANFVWERRTDHIDAVVIYDNVGRPPNVVIPARTVGPRTDLTVQPFAAAGFKAYITPRAFFRNDLRVAFDGGPDDVQLRFGFGFDF